MGLSATIGDSPMEYWVYPLQAPSADRREAMPYDRKHVELCDVMI